MLFASLNFTNYKTINPCFYMKKYLLFVSSFAFGVIPLTFFSCSDDEGNTPVRPEIVVPLEKDGYKVVLNEEFDNISMDDLGLHSTHWLLDQNGWDASLLSLENGILTINAAIASEERSFIGKNYYNEEVTKLLNKTSGIVHSEGLYGNAAGYLEVKIKFPADGDRLYPFIYIMDDNWGETPYGFTGFYHGGPNSSTLANITTVTFYPNQTTFAKGNSLGSHDDIDTMNEFNVFGIEWDRRGNIKYYLNGEWAKGSSVEWIDEDSKIYFMIGMLMDKEAEAPTRGIEVDYIRWYSKI